MKTHFVNPYRRGAFLLGWPWWVWILSGGVAMVLGATFSAIFFAIVLWMWLKRHLRPTLSRLSIRPHQQSILLAWYQPFARYQVTEIPFSELSYQVSGRELWIGNQVKTLLKIGTNRHGLSAEELDELLASLESLT